MSDISRAMKIRQAVQKSGRYLSAMIMPNIGAFIAWGLITALFIPSGWWPNESLARMVSPMLTYLLPLLIAYTAGKNVAGDRGGVAGAVAALGVIAGSDIPMFLGAMLMGPLAGWIVRKFDAWVSKRIRPGFEMLVNNFSLGITGMVLAIVGYFLVGNVVSWLTMAISSLTQSVIDRNLLPLASIVVEPAKVLFLNNAINHGIFSPIGLEQVSQTGQSVVFLIEANPGAGLGMLLACCAAARGTTRNSASGAAIIHFFGGIHEIYFPYILARPSLLLAMIAGSASGLLFFSLTGAGLVAPASPGSIISIIAMAPAGGLLPVLGGVAVAAAVSFLVAVPLLKFSRDDGETDSGKKNPACGSTADAAGHGHAGRKSGRAKVMFACDAGMGSSALGASGFRKKALMEGLDLNVGNCAADRIPEDTDIVVCQKIIAERIKGNIRDMELVVIDNFLSDPALDGLLDRLSGKAGPLPLLDAGNILLGLPSEPKEKAIERAGRVLADRGYVDTSYVAAMLEREKLATTYMGMGIAIPHGTSEAKCGVKASGISVLQYPEGVDFNGEKARLVIGIAGVGDEHLDILAGLSSVLEDGEKLQKLFSASDVRTVYGLLNGNRNI